MNKPKTAVLLMNVGSPDAPTPKAVRRYLSEFLNDECVIDIPWILRKILVNGIIIPFRVKKSTALYQKLWTEKGSPLIFISEELREKLQQDLPENYRVFVGMRYGNPGYKAALKEIRKQKFERLLVLPLFPQHALSTTETAFVAVEEEIKHWPNKPELLKQQQFYHHPDFIKAFATQAQKYEPEQFDHVLFSYHGLPNRQDQKSQPENWNSKEKYAYSIACYETSELIARELNLKKEDFSVGFQSRLSKNWLTPFSDELLKELLAKDKKRILVLAPSFVTDCLETIVEIEYDYEEEFREMGGEKLQLVHSLNAEDLWVTALRKMIVSSDTE